MGEYLLLGVILPAQEVGPVRKYLGGICSCGAVVFIQAVFFSVCLIVNISEIISEKSAYLEAFKVVRECSEVEFQGSGTVE